VPDRSSATGRRLALTADQMPRNAQGVPIDPGPTTRRTAFSPGQTIVTKVPGLDNAQAFAAQRPRARRPTSRAPTTPASVSS
jgi:hypothetical protein